MNAEDLNQIGGLLQRTRLRQSLGHERSDWHKSDYHAGADEFAGTPAHFNSILRLRHAAHGHPPCWCLWLSPPLRRSERAYPVASVGTANEHSDKAFPKPLYRYLHKGRRLGLLPWMRPHGR